MNLGVKKGQRKQQLELNLKKCKGSLDSFISVNSKASSSNDLFQNKIDCASADSVSVEQHNDVLKTLQPSATAVDELEFENPNSKNKSSLLILKYSDDPAEWPAIITDEMRDYFTQRKPEQFISEIQISTKIILNKSRILFEHNFYRHKQNKEKVKREWLIYSPSKAAVFCYVCKLFSQSCQSLCNE